jgi:transposase, IS5 family
LYEIASLRAFARLSLSEPIPDETTILNFRNLLEANDLAEDILAAVNKHLQRTGLLLKKGSIVDATIIAAPSSTKNAEDERDPEMHQTKNGNQWHFGMKAHIAVDADSGLVHTVTTTAANESVVEQIADLLHGKEQQVWAESGYRGAQARVQRDGLEWHIAARPSDIAKMPEGRSKVAAQKR